MVQPVQSRVVECGLTHEEEKVTENTTIPRGKRKPVRSMPSTTTSDGKRQLSWVSVPHRVCPFCTAAVTFESGDMSDGVNAMIEHLGEHA